MYCFWLALGFLVTLLVSMSMTKCGYMGQLSSIPNSLIIWPLLLELFFSSPIPGEFRDIYFPVLSFTPLGRNDIVGIYIHADPLKMNTRCISSCEPHVFCHPFFWEIRRWKVRQVGMCLINLIFTYSYKFIFKSENPLRPSRLRNPVWEDKPKHDEGRWTPHQTPCGQPKSSVSSI